MDNMSEIGKMFREGVCMQTRTPTCECEEGARGYIRPFSSTGDHNCRHTIQSGKSGLVAGKINAIRCFHHVHKSMSQLVSHAPLSDIALRMSFNRADLVHAIYQSINRDGPSEICVLSHA